MKIRGFTLLEMLLAMAIFAIAGIAVMQSSASHIRAVTQLEDMTIASYVADSQLQQLWLNRQWPLAEKMQGQTEMANRNWLWQISSSSVEDDDLRKLEIEVSLADDPDDKLYRLITYIGKTGD